MRNVSFLGGRGLLVLALAGGLVMLAASDSVGDQNATTNGAKKSVKSTTQNNAAAVAQKGQQKKQEPTRLHAALRELREARHEIKDVYPNHNFGGHREHALLAIDNAIIQLELVIEHHPSAKK